MCGICGLYVKSARPVDGDLLTRMTDTLRHRGPDGEGRWIDGEAGLGHRRLSIIDLAGGGQPIANEDGTLHVVFNGEIYNFIELRAQLESAGHVFRTHSDTEVIVHAYEQWGRDCVRRFNGMFAFAIWDAASRELFIARDHLGIKPLYYTSVGSTFAFGSEIKALLQVPGCGSGIDPDALVQLFTFRHVPSPKTLFEGILKLPPGHWMSVSRAGITIQRFWNFIPGPATRRARPENDLIEEYQYLLEDAVRLQMRSDVPVGLFLSSGIDSGVLLALMSQYASGPVKTFTIGFEDGDKTNETADAARLASMFGAEHQSRMLSPADYMQYYERYMMDLEEPVGNESAAAFYFVSRLAGAHVKVALTGQGADEPWAGYDRYKGVKLSAIYSRLPAVVTRGIGRIAARLPGRMERFKRGADSLGEKDMLTRLTKVHSFFNADMKRQLFKGDALRRFMDDPHGAGHSLRALHGDVGHLDPLSQVLYLDTRTNLPDDLLMVNDKTSMANSLETRVPFLDYRLVEFVENLPPHLKLRGLTGKYLHKKACAKWLPKEVVHRKKKGFANPVEKWFREGMKDFVEDCLLASDSSMARYFDQDYIGRIIREDRAGRQQYRRHLYLLVSLELWHRTFLRS